MNTANNVNSSKSTMSESANLPANGPVTVNKLDNSKNKVEKDDDFKISDLNPEEKKINNMPAANNSNSTKVLNTDIPEDLDAEMEDMDKPSSKTSNGVTDKGMNTGSKESGNMNTGTDKGMNTGTKTGTFNELKADEDSEFPVVSAESAVRNNLNRVENKTANKTANNEPVLEDVKPLITTPVTRTKKAHKRGAKSAVDLKTLKAAHLLVNQATGSVKVDTSSKPPTIVKLIQPVNKANIKLKTFKTKYEKEYEHMKKMSTDELLALKSKLEAIEFDEVANTNIINGLLELVDDHHLKQLTIEKMLKMGDITINF
jgi:hypothetical protein